MGGVKPVVGKGDAADEPGGIDVLHRLGHPLFPDVIGALPPPPGQKGQKLLLHLRRRGLEPVPLPHGHIVDLPGQPLGVQLRQHRAAPGLAAGAAHDELPVPNAQGHMVQRLGKGLRLAHTGELPLRALIGPGVIPHPLDVDLRRHIGPLHARRHPGRAPLLGRHTSFLPSFQLLSPPHVAGGGKVCYDNFQQVFFVRSVRRSFPPVFSFSAFGNDVRWSILWTSRNLSSG